MIVLGALDVVVVALLVLLLLYGVYLFVEVESKLLGRTPVIGGYLSGWLSDAASWLKKHMLQIAIGSLGPIGALFLWWWHAHSQTNAKAQTAVKAIQKKLRWIVRTDIPDHTTHAIQAAISYADMEAAKARVARQDDVAKINAEIAAAKAGAETYANGLAHNLQLNMNADARQATAYTNAVGATVAHRLTTQGHTIAGELRGIEQWASTSFSDLSHQATGEAQRAIDYATSIGQEALRYADNVGTTVYHETIGALDHQAVHVAQSLWAGLPGAANSAAKQLQVINPNAAGGLVSTPTAAPPTLAALLGAMIGVAKTTITAVDTCVLPNCPEKNKLATEAKHLSDLLGTALGLAFLVEMIQHPTTTARDSVEVIDAIATPVVDSVRALF